MLAKLHALFLWLYIPLFMVFSILLMIPVAILGAPGLKRFQSPLIVFLARFWAKMIIFLTGSKLEIVGAENFPEHHNYCVISNHQGSLDIPIIMATVPWKVAFIAKKELKKAPIIGWWMQIIGVLFLDRSNSRQAVAVLNEAAQKIQSGHPMVIFPEGTRSKGGPIAPFKKGSLKLAVKANTTVVPITIDGSYRVFEAQKFGVKGAKIAVTVHKPIEMSTLEKDEKDLLSEKLFNTISEPLKTQ